MNCDLKVVSLNLSHAYCCVLLKLISVAFLLGKFAASC